jgi:hypothetical protein
MVLRREMLGEEVFELGVASLERETDDAKVGRWIIDFIAAAGTQKTAELQAGEYA